jgi:hypothetical protein
MPSYGYGSSWYGDTDDYYGNVSSTAALTGEVQWIFLVDWDGTNTFAYNEGPYMIDMEVSRGQRYLVQERGDGFETMRPGEGTVTLTDKLRRFDPDYAAGPLYGKILPGRKFQLKVKDLATGTVYPIMAGYINDIPPITEVDHVQLALRESISLLDKRVNIPMLYRNSISGAMNELLSAAKFPNTFSSTIGAETQQVTAFAVDNINALNTLLELGAACLGQVFADNSGRIRFYARGYASMPTIAIDQADCNKAIRRSQPWENLRNIIQVVTNKKVKKREEAIWQSGIIALPANATTTIAVEYGEAIDVRIYSLTANSLATGKGADRSNLVTRNVSAYAGSMSIALTNTANSVTYVTKLIVTGRPIVNQALRTEVRNALSESTYGEMVFNLDNPWLQDYTHAVEYATMISNFLDEPERTIEIEIDQRPALQYSFDLMDHIHFTSAKLGITTATALYAGYIRHRWQLDTGQDVRTTLVMRPRLTDATSIGNDAEDPDLPYIPEADNQLGWPISMPSVPNPPPAVVDPDPSKTCPVDLPANGPYDLGWTGIILASTGHPSINLYSKVRSSSHANRTTYVLQGVWYKKVGGSWEETTDDAFYNIYALDAAGNKIATAVHDAVVGSGYQRTGYFNVPAATLVSGFRLEINSLDIGTVTSVERWFVRDGAGLTLEDDAVPWTMNGAGFRVALNAQTATGGWYVGKVYYRLRGLDRVSITSRFDVGYVQSTSSIWQLFAGINEFIPDEPPILGGFGSSDATRRDYASPVSVATIYAPGDATRKLWRYRPIVEPNHDRYGRCF